MTTTVCRLLVCSCLLAAAPAAAQEPFEPQPGQEGKDVVWVPTPAETVERMLDIAHVTPQDYVIDLGSGDGRNVIAAARRGARALGVEYNPKMVALSRQRAAEAGVATRATFVEGDMYEADISQANVMALFLLPSNMLRLRPKFLALAPGSRIVSNTFGMEGWDADYTEVRPDCNAWCTILLWVVPARVEGTWQSTAGALTLTQTYQMLFGTLGGAQVNEGRLRGTDIRFVAGGRTYSGTVSGDTMQGTTDAGTPWSARRIP